MNKANFTTVHELKIRSKDQAIIRTPLLIPSFCIGEKVRQKIMRQLIRIVAVFFISLRDDQLYDNQRSQLEWFSFVGQEMTILSIIKQV